MTRVLDGVVEGVDLCLNAPGEYGQCSKRRFPKCAPNMRLCIYRQPRTDLFYDNLKRDPAYYIDYDTIECVPVYNTAKHRKWNCNLCDPGGEFDLRYPFSYDTSVFSRFLIMLPFLETT